MASFYISPTGNNSTGDGSSGNPWKTLNFAIGASADGDTVILKDGTYTNCITAACVSVSNRTIKAENTHKAIITQSFNTTILPIYGYFISVASTKTVTIQGIKFTDCVGSEGLSFLRPLYGGTIVVDYCIFERFSVPAGESFYIFLGGPMTIKNCIFYEINLTGGVPIVLSNSGTINFFNNTFYSSTQSYNYGIVSNSATFNIKNCIIQNASLTKTVYYNLGGTATNASYSCFRNITSPPTGTGIITSDPLFIDPRNYVLYLHPNSPCRGTGTAL